MCGSRLIGRHAFVFISVHVKCKTAREATCVLTGTGSLFGSVLCLAETKCGSEIR